MDVWGRMETWRHKATAITGGSVDLGRESCSLGLSSVLYIFRSGRYGGSLCWLD